MCIETLLQSFEALRHVNKILSDSLYAFITNSMLLNMQIQFLLHYEVI